MNKAFTLVEILIVVAILGILAALTLPIFKDYITEAKEAAAKDNLRILRNTIEIYAAQHNGVPPGYPYDDPSQAPTHLSFMIRLIIIGKYLPEMPKNPFNGKTLLKMVLDNEDFPTTPAQTDTYGWIYKPRTKTIKLNWLGTDLAGTPYYDY